MSKGRIQFWLGLASLALALVLGMGLASNTFAATPKPGMQPTNPVNLSSQGMSTDSAPSSLGNAPQVGNVAVLTGHLTPPEKASAAKPSVQVLNTDYTLDMGALGIHPTDKPMPLRPGPNGGAIGTSNAYMSASPDVVRPSTTSAIGTIGMGFNPGETVSYYLNGALALTGAASAQGYFAVGITTGAGDGYITFEEIGAASGKRAGTVVQVLSTATIVPGYASVPHAVNTSGGTGSLLHYGFQWIPSSTGVVTLQRNGVSIGTVSTSAAGRFFVLTTPANNGDTAAVYTAISTTAGYMSGVSVEERADAGVPPAGDNNVSRAFVDRPIMPVAGGTVAISGEGFQAGETVNITGCTTGSVVATANGAASVFLTFGSGAGVSLCTFTGATSGRVGRAAVQKDANAVNVPSGINAPATINTAATNFIFMYDRLAANITGTLFLDGVSQGPAPATNANGFNSVTVVPTTTLAVGIHEVAFIGGNGQIAIAPLYVIPAGGGGPTNTPTNSPTPTATVTPICPGAWVAQAPYPAPALDEAIAVQSGVLYSFSGVVSGAISPNSFKYDPGPNTWTAIAPLPSGRENAAAVSDGTFLYIVGGNDSAGAVTGSLFRYDPVANTYTTLASAATATRGQAAAYLNGKIYKVGGLDTASAGVNVLEIYDIASGLWSTGAVYPQSVGFLMATALGNFVYAGGGTGAADTAKTYRYDPTAGTWDDAAIADLPAPRWGAASDNLKGKWMLAGGYVNGLISASATRWDSGSNAWEIADQMPQARSRLAGGTVGVSFYAVAGRDPVIGGFTGTTDNQRYTNLCQATPTGTPPTATITNTPIPTQTPTATLTPVCPGAWTTTAAVYPRGILDNAVTSVGGNLYSFAGVSANAIISASYKYDPVGNAWTQIANLPSEREQASAVSDGTFAYILGGASLTGANTNTLYRYDPVGNSYTVLASNPFTSTWAQAGAYLNGKIYWIAGCGPNCATFSNVVSVYDVGLGTWSAAANYPDSVGWLMATAIGNFVYTAGGVNANESAKTYRYDPTAGTWDDAAIADLPDGRWGSAEDNVKGKWLITGGFTFTDPDVVNTGFVWDPTTNTWSAIDPLPAARGRFSGGTVGVAFYGVGGRAVGGGFAGTNDNQRYQNICQTPTATPTPAGVINGHLTWQNVLAPNRPAVTGTLTLCNAGVPQNFLFTTDTNGNFVVASGLPDGTYNWRVKGGRHLANAGTLTITGGASTQEFGLQRGGDVVQAPASQLNIVNSSDFNAQKLQFGQGGTLSGDVDYNLVVNSSDFNILKLNFGQAGAAVNCP